MTMTRASLLFVLLSSFAGSSLAADDVKKPFGPWDAGEARAVKRHGKNGKARVEHPMVGEAAKVPASGPPPPKLRTDPDVPETVLETANAMPGQGLSSNPLFLAALFYSNYLTKVDGARCRHFPTCSRFANQAVARHGALGILIGLERVITDEQSSSIRRLPEVDTGGGPFFPRFYDPIENYEWWVPSSLLEIEAPAAEEPLALTPLVDNEGTSAARDNGTKGLPKCPNGRTIRPPDEDEEDRCAPERS